MIKSTKGSLVYSLSSLIGKSTIRFLEFVINLFVPKKIIFDNKDFDWVVKVEAYYKEILKEYEEITKNNLLKDITEISVEQNSVINKKEWFFFPLYVYGLPISSNLNKCPKTHEALSHIPNLTTVFFSTLTPKTYIKTHRGAYKGFLRYHLGVIIPDDKNEKETCRIRIKGTEYGWENGKSIIFDDTYLHDAWNNTEETRVVLYVDFIRPMPALLQFITKKLTILIQKSPFIKNGLKNYKLNNKEELINMIK